MERGSASDACSVDSATARCIYYLTGCICEPGIGLYICDDRVRALAAELAARRGCTLTEAVRAALEDELARGAAQREEKQRRTRAIIAAMKAVPDPASPRTGYTTTRATRSCDACRRHVGGRRSVRSDQRASILMGA